MIDFWQEYWNRINKNIPDNPHTRIHRTKHGKPISDIAWERTVNYITNKLKLNKKMKVLELCCGNGLLTEHISRQVEKIVAVDYSDALVTELKDKRINNVQVINDDIRHFQTDEYIFDVVLFYFSIQYFSLSEAANIFKNIYKMMNKNSILFIGDIPDMDKIWKFYYKKSFRDDFFDAKERNESIIGTWYKKQTIAYLAEWSGFKTTKIIKQPRYMINSSYRYDVLIRK